MNLRQRPAANHVLLRLLPVMAEEFGLHVVLGAFLAGIGLRR